MAPPAPSSRTFGSLAAALTALGCGAKPPDPRLPDPAHATCTRQLDDSRAWYDIARAFQAVDAKPGDRSDTHELLTVAVKQAEELSAKGTLAAPEAKLLQSELERLRGVYAPPREMPEGMTCYSPQPPADFTAANAIAYRLPMLEELARTKTLHEAVLCRILDPLEQEITTALRHDILHFAVR
jgi:hypothetical protein